MNGRRTHFERLHARSADPWGVRDRWYERRKRALTLAALPRPRYRNGFEPGCSIGVLSAALAERCETLECWDPSESAVARARQNLARHPGVRVLRRALPSSLPEACFDLVVLSEVGYYLPRDALLGTTRSLRRALAPGGDLLACHFRHEIPDGEETGDEVHRILAQELGLPLRTRVCDADFRVDVWSDDRAEPGSEPCSR